MPRLRVALSGPGPVENWAVNADFALTSAVPNLATLQTIATDLFGLIAADANLRAGWSLDSHLTEVKLLHYPGFSGPANIVAIGTGAAVVGAAATVHAPQICVVASLRTNLAGRSYRGRQYWPYRGGDILSSGLVTAPGQALIALVANSLKNDVVTACTASSIGAAWGVYSPKLSLMTPIVDVLVGTQCDTQRRRNVNRAETYAVSPVTATEIPVADADAKSVIDGVISQFLNTPINLSDGVLAAEAIAQVVSVIDEG